MLYPLTFRPRFKERVWGGRSLETLFGKSLPPGLPIGESWEISDRPGDESVIANGALAGKSLRWLMDRHGPDLLGRTPVGNERFPLLIKILDAREKLSLQVHPPAKQAQAMGGEPKTEMWYVVDATPDAALYAGLRRGVTKQEFTKRVADGTVEDCFHRLAVRPGDAMFLPSGRVHAIGAGLVIFEVQQNSDTTYRVFDWNRVGLDGKPRQLHIQESLASIDFADFEPALVPQHARAVGPASVRPLVKDPLFTVEACGLPPDSNHPLADNRLQIVGVLSGHVDIRTPDASLGLDAGQFGLIPADLTEAVVRSSSVAASFLKIETGGAPA